MTRIVPVSVIVPCFNSEQTVERAIKSIAEQTVQPREVILVDDGSQTSLMDVFEQLAVSYDLPIKAHRFEKNRGPSFARNFGWNLATSDFVAFLDSDDTWHPRKLEVQVSFMEANAQVTLTGHRIIHPQQKWSPALSLNKTAIKVISSRSLLFSNAFSTPTVILRNNLGLRFNEAKRHAEDLYLWQQIAFAGNEIVLIEQHLAKIHKRAYGDGGQSKEIHIMEMEELRNLYYLWKSQSIGTFIAIVAAAWSIIKYFTRILVVSVRSRAE